MPLLPKGREWRQIMGAIFCPEWFEDAGDLAPLDEGSAERMTTETMIKMVTRSSFGWFGMKLRPPKYC